MTPLLTRINNCPGCDSANLQPLYKAKHPVTSDTFFFERFAMPYQNVRFDLCKDCGLLFLNPRWTAAALERLYGQENIYRKVSLDYLQTRQPGANEFDMQAEIDPTIRDSSIIHIGHYERFLWIKENIENLKELRIVDVGAGWGSPWTAVKALGLNYVGFDSSPELAKLAKSLGRPIECVPFQDLPQKANADLIYTSQFLEHVDVPLECVKHLRQCLKDGGYLFIDVPTFNFLPSHFSMFSAPQTARTCMNWGHMNHFDHVSLTNLLAKAGFEVVRYSYYKGDIRVLAQKKSAEQLPHLYIRPRPAMVNFNVNVLSYALAPFSSVYNGSRNALKNLLSSLGLLSWIKKFRSACKPA